MNLNYLFNKEFYSCLADDSVDNGSYYRKKTEELCTIVFDQKMHDDAVMGFQTDNLRSFTMKTLYPGLLVGIGNPHGSGIDSDEENDNGENKSNDDIKLGFSFDYVTGMPYIPGSTIKGVLKSAFRHKELIRDLCGLDDENIDILTDEIFNNGYEVINSNGLKTKQRDIFYDAVIVSGNKNGHILGTEYITHHSSPLRNPNPIQLIKIIPDVKFEFRFKLGGSDRTGITAEKKLTLFADIIAKTNTGFGIMRKLDNFEYSKPKELTPIQELRYGSCSSAQESVSDNARHDGVRAGSDSKPSQNTSKDFINCPYCGNRNYRTNRKTGKINYSWEKGFCWSCKKNIDTKGAVK